MKGVQLVTKLGGQSVMKGKHSSTDRSYSWPPPSRERTGNGPACETLKPAPSDVLPPAEVHLLKVPEHLKVSSTNNRDQLLKHLSLGSTILFQKRRVFQMLFPLSSTHFERGSVHFASLENK